MIRLALILLALAGPVAAQTIPPRGPKPPEGSAIATAVWTEEGSRIHVYGTMTADGNLLTENDMWHIGSLTKAMTATLAARTVVAGLIEWDTPIGAVLEADPAWQDVTLAELLTHRSGMAANLPRWRAVFRPDRAAYVRHMLGSSPAGARGGFLYSNAGYVIAGAMLEAVHGATWEDLMRRDVFEPLDMEGVGFGPPQAIWGHLGDRAVPPGPRADNIPAMGPAGTVHASPVAMMRFLAAHATRDPNFLPQAAWDRLHMPVGDYAMGWGADGAALRHAGSNTMWFARVEIREGGAAFVAINRGSEAAAVWTDQTMEAIWHDAPPAMPEAPRPSE